MDLAKNLLSDYIEPQSLILLCNMPMKAIGLAIAFVFHLLSPKGRNIVRVRVTGWPREKNLNFQWRAQVCVSFLGAVLCCAKLLQS